jgi:hypothetical protein
VPTLAGPHLDKTQLLGFIDRSPNGTPLNAEGHELSIWRHQVAI